MNRQDDAPQMEYVAMEIRVRGRVQGVGFRPTVWRFARDLGLCGEVLNDAQGVVVRAGGSSRAVDDLLGRIKSEPPPLARIGGIETRLFIGDLPPRFRIAKTLPGDPHTQVTPDAAVCPARRKLPIRLNGASAIRSPAAPIAVRALASSGAFLMIAATLPWPDSQCARRAGQNTPIRPTAGSTLKQSLGPLAFQRRGPELRNDPVAHLNAEYQTELARVSSQDVGAPLTRVSATFSASTRDLSQNGNSIRIMSGYGINDRFWRRVQPIAATHSGNFSAGVIEQGLSRPFIELPCDGTELGLAEQGQIGAKGKILAQQSVGVFV